MLNTLKIKFMRNVLLILFCSLLSVSFQSTQDFSTPKSAVETFILASTQMDKNVLSECFSDHSPGEWDEIRNKTVSKKDLKELKEFVQGAEITNIEMEGENQAIVFVKFTTRDEKIHTVKENGRWFISDF